MSSKKLLFIISLVILTGSLMSFNANPKLNFHSISSSIEVATDTLPSDIQERVAELHRKREEIRKEVERIKAEEAAKAIKKAEAEKIALEKAKKKANKEAIAQIKAEGKAKKRAAKEKAAAPDKAAAEQLAMQKQAQREAELAAKKIAAEKQKAIKKAKAEKLAEERRKQREADAIVKAREKVEAAKIKAKQDAIAQQEQAARKAEQDRLKAIRKVEQDKLKAAKKLEAERLAEERRIQREANAVAKAQAKADKLKAAAEEGDKETSDLKERLAKARENVNTAVPDEDPLKAAKKRDAELAKQKRKQERVALAAVRAKERAQKAALKQKQKEEAAALAAKMEAKRQREATAAAQAGLVYDEAPPGVEEIPVVNEPVEIEYKEVPSSESVGSEESQRIYGESVEVANKQEGVENTPKVITEGIMPPPTPTPDVAAKGNKDRTKDAVAKALDREKKKRKKGRKGIKLPGTNKSNVSDIDLDDCDFEFNEFDPITQKVKRGLTKRFFFSYTEDILKEYMQGEDYLVCTGGLIDIQGILALGIEFVIDSPQARYEYGSIGTNAQLILQLIDGETITLLSEQSDSGRVNRSTEKTEFSTIFLINPREEKTLRKTEISAVRMVWGTGYEDYDVNEIDFLIDQFQCIDAARDN